ncbi:hypothetical protein SeLEV6574_g02876 [Synchytrium endobioticum]|nr:hypothetical protein SeLEV6574_g02876 [Synchytrium endobioticum]
MTRREVHRFQDLTSDEVSDLFQSVQAIGKVLEREYRGEALSIALQDGPVAGQTVPHVHVHVIARRKGDYGNNDEIYKEMDKNEKDIAQILQKSTAAGAAAGGSSSDKKSGVDNEERKPRSADEMAAEAAKLREYFEQHEDIWS